MTRRRRLTASRGDVADTAYPRATFVLIVEDHADTRELFAMFFLAHGFTVQTADNGELGVARAIASRPDVIVMDLSLPFLDGWEATRRLKADPRTRHIPIVACTAHAFGDAVERAMEAAVDAYVVKPCEPSDLLLHVRNVLSRVSERHRRRA
jgi:CheY-like chemotaxis protein